MSDEIFNGLYDRLTKLFQGIEDVKSQIRGIQPTDKTPEELLALLFLMRADVEQTHKDIAAHQAAQPQPKSKAPRTGHFNELPKELQGLVDEAQSEINAFVDGDYQAVIAALFKSDAACNSQDALIHLTHHLMNEDYDDDEQVNPDSRYGVIIRSLVQGAQRRACKAVELALRLQEGELYELLSEQNYFDNGLCGHDELKAEETYSSLDELRSDLKKSTILGLHTANEISGLIGDIRGARESE